MSRRHIPDAVKARAIALRQGERLGIDAIRDATGLSVGTLSVLLRDHPLTKTEVEAAKTAGRAKGNETRWGTHIPQRGTKPPDHPWSVSLEAYRIWPDGSARCLGRGEARAMIAARGRTPVVVHLGPQEPFEVPRAFRLRPNGNELLVFVSLGLHDGVASVVLGSDVINVRRGATPQWCQLSHVDSATYRDIARDLLREGSATQVNQLARFLSTHHAALAVRRSGQIKPVLGDQWAARMWGRAPRVMPEATDIAFWSLAKSRVVASASARVRAYEAPAPITAPRVRAEPTPLDARGHDLTAR
ncbi:MAG: hypothetical protein H3C62_01250 [Gemmatimonadaceae bacterium]|nr:hypothetical protein [Gemmatimonadaceae bacterium]